MATTAKPKRKSKLNDLATLILENAADRKDRLVLPLPESLAASGEEVDKTLKDLLTRKLIEECSAKLEDNIWRTDEEQRHLTLRLSSAGQKAFTAEVAAEAATPVIEPPPAKPRHRDSQGPKAAAAKASKTSPSRDKQATKAERILALLRRPQGATIAELTKSTGWQAHSIRGLLSATLKRKMKLKVKSECPEGKERRYRVA